MTTTTPATPTSTSTTATPRAHTSDRRGTAVVTLPSDTEILISRVFDAPAALLFRAWTTPSLVRRWWCCDQSEWLVCDIDLRVGGRWRYVFRTEGMEVGFHGEYREIDAPHRLVSTEVFEGMPDGEALNIISFDEADGVTTMRTLVRHTCREHRDAHLNSGMETGMQIALDRLESVAVGALAS